VCRRPRHRQGVHRNGLLVGAAIGAGFAIFESAGYAFNALLGSRSVDSMTTILVRAFLAPFGHVAWTAIAAGALWRVKGDQPLHPRMLVDIRFLRPFCIPVILHMLWNMPLPSPLFLRHLALGGIGWFVVFGFVQEGLRQIKGEQAAIQRGGPLAPVPSTSGA
jgi:RsiW-degrading membrane proteinase PrsW (M82 family)